MTTKMTHTPTPWKVWGASIIYSEEGKATIAAVSEPRGSQFVAYQPLEIGSPDFKEATANAAHIVSCVNEREGLLANLKNCINRLRNQGDCSQITQEMNDAVVKDAEAALAQAEREEG